MTEPAQEPSHDVAAALRAIAGMLIFAIIAMLSFHPWVLTAVAQVVDFVPMLVLVLIFVYVMRPIVNLIEGLFRRLPGSGHVSEAKSLALTYLCLLLVIVLVGSWVLPRLVDEVRLLATKLPAYTDTVRTTLQEYRERLGTLVPIPLQNQISEATSSVGQMLAKALQRGVGYVGTVSSAVLWVISACFLVPLLGFYFLKDHSGLLEFNLRLLPPRARYKVRMVLIDLHLAMQNFIKGQVVLCLAIGTVTTIAMLFVLREYAIALGIIAGITEAIPVLGPIIGAIPAVIIAFAAKGIGTAIVVVVIYLAIQQLENTVLVPRIMGETLGLHPLSLLIGLSVFGDLFGFWGVLLSSPLVAAVKILVMHTIMHAPPSPQAKAEAEAAADEAAEALAHEVPDPASMHAPPSPQAKAEAAAAVDEAAEALAYEAPDPAPAPPDAVPAPTDDAPAPRDVTSAPE